ncbi:LamG-like jellyroll fold domain-containing protein [Nocardiopsis sp. YSL2]|uniref:LamG-like jellyroll fold domain-containing protein n=1 Tax=Nocardiopsis sp. YSL2 TaxID=2939492 RepID=UPI0026F40D8D|nr:LamG-like jellyroll fold domain-containing protein [Nocardiopsis sp. YSL2]
MTPPRSPRPPRPLGRTVAAAVGLTLATALVHADPAAAAELPAPAVHYDFTSDDLSTGTITDVSGNGRHGTLAHGSTAALVEGADGGGALGLPGGAADSGAHVALPADVLGGATDLTASIRVRWSGASAPWQWMYALGTDNARYLFSTPANGDGRLRTAVTGNGGNAEDRVTGSAALPEGEWRTVTVTLDTGAERVTTYLDGAAVGSAPTSLAAGDLVDGTGDLAGYIGRSFYSDPLFEGAVDDFRVYHSALTPEQVAELALGDVPEPTGLVQDSFEVLTTLGTAPDLPATVPATFSDGYERPLAAEWDEVDPADYEDTGTFTVAGTVGERAVTAEVTVIREGQLSIDLSTDTGAFHGGASGSLYGLYGPGLPTDNIIEGMGVRTVATKGQDGAQHPGSDALEVVGPLAGASGGDVYVRTTDYYRGFPYQWPGETPEEKLSGYMDVLARQLDQIRQLDPEVREHIVIEPFNEPEGNMFGSGEWSYDGTSWLDDPTDYFAAWDTAHGMIREALPDVRISGPNTSVLYAQNRDFLRHGVEAGTVPDIISWHELSHPAQIRTSVDRYRQWEREVFAGTEHEGTELPINVNEYAFNYHTSVPGQMVQWMSAIEESKIDAMIAFWNINGNLSDSSVEANRANGQWWLYNSYSRMSGHTVEVAPPFPGENYTLQGLAAVDEEQARAKALFGGADGPAWVEFDNVPEDVFGSSVHAWVREISWSGQLGDSGPPRLVSEEVLEVQDGSVVLDFGGSLPELTESSAYEVVLTPAGEGTTSTGVPPTLWQGSFEAEDAEYTGSGYSLNGPEGSPSDVSKFYTSGGYDVGGLRTGSDGVLDFTVDVPEAGTYDLSVFANSLYTDERVADQGPTNVFLRVNGGAEQEVFLPLAYKWVVWDHADTTVDLRAGENVITLAARSLDGSGATRGDAIIDRLTLELPAPSADTVRYEAELAELDGAAAVHSHRHIERVGASGSGGVDVGRDESVTFWVYSAEDAESTIDVHTVSKGRTELAVNGRHVADTGPGTTSVAVSLSGGVNKVTLTGTVRSSIIDGIEVTPTDEHLATTVHQAEDAALAGDAEVAELPLAATGSAVTGIGGDPGNGNTLTFEVEAARAGTFAMRVRYANPETSPTTHYNPNPVARHADISVNGADPRTVLFPPTFHENNFWTLTVPVELERGVNTIAFSAEEQPNFEGDSLISEDWPDLVLRSPYAPVIDNITVAEFTSGPLRR